jgi:hypothetical protein
MSLTVLLLTLGILHAALPCAPTGTIAMDHPARIIALLGMAHQVRS